MELRSEVSLGIAVYRIAGKIDASTGPDLETAVGSAIIGGNAHIVLDMREVTYVSSAGLRGILSAAKRAAAAKGALAIFGLRPAVQEVFEISGFHNIIPIVADEIKARSRVGD